MLTRHCHTFSQMTLEVLSIGIQSKTIDIRLIEALVARVFPCTVPSHVERVDEGVSTYVYKIYRGHEVFYLRVLPEVNASFAPEVYVHEMLRAKDVKVPEVVYFEHYNEALQRSVMVTTAIKGKHIGHYHVNEVSRNTLVEAGQDLAVINSVPVKHFGWIRRDSSAVTALEAELPTYRAFVFEYLEEDLAFLNEYVLSTREIKAIRGIVDRCGAWLDVEKAWLAHGDFDATHIYQEHGRYTGIIDFGEIGAATPSTTWGTSRCTTERHSLPGCFPIFSQAIKRLFNSRRTMSRGYIFPAC